MVLVVLVVLFLIFGGLGFVLHLLWIAALVVLAVAVWHALTRRSASRT